jgi:hypothetical protein
MNKNHPQRNAQNRPYETIKARVEGSRDQQDNRKHNSPDINRFRTAENRQAYTANRKARNDKEDPKYQKKDREDASPEYAKANKAGRELNKNSSTPALKDERRVQEEENQEYVKLHERLSFIESKIADMKRHVQKKRE